MATWNKDIITILNGKQVSAMAPVIVSASRSTDIPAFYSDWFFHRLSEGYSAWKNPFNGKYSYVSYHRTKFIVFWSKDPSPLLKYLDKLKTMNGGIGCYIQYTMNDYDKEGLEKGVPPLPHRIDTFKRLVDYFGGPGQVIWRHDPLILTDKIDSNQLLDKIERIGDQLKGYTERLVFSYADIVEYTKVRRNLENNGIKYKEWQPEQMIEFAAKLVEMNRSKGWNYELATCGELGQYPEIIPNHCVDDRLIVRFGYKSPEILKLLGAEIISPLGDLFGTPQIPSDAIELDGGLYAVIKKNNRDAGQRTSCGCCISKDIGEYNTCPHQCEYCYANTTKEIALENYNRYCNNKESETITGVNNANL